MGWYCARCGIRANAPGACPRDGSPLAAVEAVLGRAAGNYTLVGRLGTGGMGEVFRAINPTIEAEVAIKVLHANATAGSDAGRFIVEARAVNRVRHDGVARILDAGYLETGRPYLVMELLEGESLEQLLARTRVELPVALNIIDDVLAVVAAAHAADIVHRDLKPPNVFLTRTGRTVVLDFGVAKLLDSTATLTRTGAMIGTPAYMAPEQIQAFEIDGRTDVYAVGVMLHELLAGARPFAGSTFDVVKDHIQRPPPRLPATVPRSLQQVVDRALAKSPANRFASATAMREALAATGPHAVSGGPRRRNRGWVLAAGGLVAACALVLAVVVLREDRTPTTVLAEVSPDAAPVGTPDAAVPDAALDAPAVDAADLAATIASLPDPPTTARKPAATADLAELATVVTEIKQRMATRALAPIDLPKSARDAFVEARLAADMPLLHRRALELRAAVEQVVIDARLVNEKLGYVRQAFELRRATTDATRVQQVSAQLARATQLAAADRIEDANKALTAIYNELAKWPKPGASPPPQPDDGWK